MFKDQVLEFDTDVLIVGAGPAGTAMALGLLNEEKSLDVTVVEQSNLVRVRVGESVAPGIFQFLDYLKIDRNDFEPGTFAPSQSVTTYWGSEHPLVRDAIFSAEQPGVQLDREKFDLYCIGKVADRGGRVFPRTRCLRVGQRADGRWEVELEHSERGRMRVTSTYLVDATGRQAGLGKMAGLHSEKYDKLVGVGQFLVEGWAAAEARTQLIEASELGWWYTAALPNRQRVITLFSDADLVAKHRLNDEGKWRELLAQTSFIKEELRGVLPDEGLWVRNAFTQITGPKGVSGFLSVGDAACSFDPLSSMGIGFAISSGCQAARVVLKDVEEPQSGALEIYAGDIVANFKSYLALRESFYSREQRWPEAEFWKRRHQRQRVSVNQSTVFSR